MWPHPPTLPPSHCPTVPASFVSQAPHLPPLAVQHAEDAVMPAEKLDEHVVQANAPSGRREGRLHQTGAVAEVAVHAHAPALMLLRRHPVAHAVRELLRVHAVGQLTLEEEAAPEVPSPHYSIPQAMLRCQPVDHRASAPALEARATAVLRRTHQMIFLPRLGGLPRPQDGVVCPPEPQVVPDDVVFEDTDHRVHRHAPVHVRSPNSDKNIGHNPSY
mmetsp:Transcript_15778/g.34907  ORF Transcript_15778/g.34907 Transcript_15778/m.34907 type:complete len:217 (-) Transcript_15778:1654-2304(-)